MQRAGRAGQNTNLQAWAVLYIEASALKAVTRKDKGESESEREPEDMPEMKTYHKKIELSLRE
jgi:hypothetical protein